MLPHGLVPASKQVHAERLAAGLVPRFRPACKLSHAEARVPPSGPVRAPVALCARGSLTVPWEDARRQLQTAPATGGFARCRVYSLGPIRDRPQVTQSSTNGQNGLKRCLTLAGEFHSLIKACKLKKISRRVS